MFVKKLAAFALSIAVLLSTTSMPLSATKTTDNRNSRLAYVTSIDNSFVIINGVAHIESRYEGDEDVFDSICIEITLQRKGLFSWSDVDNGDWCDIKSSLSGRVYHSLTLTKTGKYRVLITCTAYNADGEEEVITETLTYEY